MYKLLLCLFALAAPLSASTATTAPQRDYYAPLNNADKANIRYIINTLAYKSTLSLLFYQTSLENAGNQTRHIHPLRFFDFVFSDPELKVAVRRINGTPWSRFVAGMAGSFQTSANHDNMKEEYLDNFSHTVGVEKNLLQPSYQNHQWSQFINIARNHTR